MGRFLLAAMLLIAAVAYVFLRAGAAESRTRVVLLP